MVKYFCDVKGCNFMSVNSRDFKHVNLEMTDDVLGTTLIAGYDMCPECYEKFTRMHKSFFKSEDDQSTAEEENETDTNADTASDKLYDPEVFNEYFMNLFSGIVDCRFDEMEREAIEYYNKHYQIMNYRLIELLRSYFANTSYHKVAEEYDLPAGFVKDMYYTDLNPINSGEVNFEKDPTVSMRPYVEKYWLNVAEAPELNYECFSYYIFYIVNVISGYIRGDSHFADNVRLHADSATVKRLYVTLDKILFNTPYTVSEMNKYCGELVTLKDVVAAMVVVGTDNSDAMYTEKLAKELGMDLKAVEPLVIDYLSITKSILDYYTNEYRYGKSFDQIFNKYYLYKRTINAIEKIVK